MKAAEYRAKAARGMREEDLEEHVRDLCKVYDVTRVHHLRSKGTTPGWPDDALIGTRMIYRELKGSRGRVSPAQRKMIAEMRAAGADVDVWWPDDLVTGRVQREIAEISRRQIGRRPA